MYFKQYRDDGCLSYLLGCKKQKEAVVIDPGHGADKYMQDAGVAGFKIVAIIDTHSHVDHVSSAGELAAASAAPVCMHENVTLQRSLALPEADQFGVGEILRANGAITIDRPLKEDDSVQVGDLTLQVLHTPGHTRDSICLKVKGRNLLFTGDTLFVGQCGRTDLPGGDSTDLYHSLFDKIMPLKDTFSVCPAHDYRGFPNSALGYEKVTNIFLRKRTIEEFAAFVKKFFPPITPGAALLQCGTSYDSDAGEEAGKVSPLMSKMCVAMEQFLQYTPQEWNDIRGDELHDLLDGENPSLVIDVRQPSERRRGFIPGSLNIPLPELPGRVDELPRDKDAPVVVVCQSGNRSSYAALYLRAYGYSKIRNLEYGMTGWENAGFPLYTD